MRVAIIGAGLSGLYCAIELERLGIRPDIYEQNSFIGESYSHVAAVLGITHRPYPDLLSYIKRNFHIEITPLTTVNTLEHHSPSKTTILKGNFGYFFKYSRDEDSLKGQMAKKLKKTRIHFNERPDYEKLSKEYDYVVVANGNWDVPNELGCWQQWLYTYMRGAVVLGDFDPNTIIMWINKDYTKNGYAYLTPFDNKRASLVLIATTLNEREVDYYWELFLTGERIKNTIIDEFKLQHRSGLVYPHSLGNVYFIGNAAGGVEPFLGFGHFNAVNSAIFAARSIVLGRSYEKQLKGVVERNVQMRQFRKMYDMLTNKDYDMLMTILKVPGMKHLLYTSNVNISKYGALLSNLVVNRTNR